MKEGHRTDMGTRSLSLPSYVGQRMSHDSQCNFCDDGGTCAPPYLPPVDMGRRVTWVLQSMTQRQNTFEVSLVVSRSA